ncbi:MAG: SOS response-associated peptidase [Xanthobacteraceae bacterium]|nr:SOS response-associated peptidase [Xanthobacteraceae bacterium]
MCGRFVIISTPETLLRLLGFVERPNFPPRYNVAPTQPVPIVRLVAGKRRFALVHWGLIPSWVKDPREFALLINARIEGLTDKPSFRAAVKRRRCLVPADGFYEWQKAGKAKRPFFIRPRAGGPIAFAGLWETWADRDGGEIDTMAIVTCAANKTLAPIHDRMPAIVAPKNFDAWLDAEKVEAKTAIALLGPAPDDLLEVQEISTRVNNARNDGPELIAAVTAGSSARG